jgi:hypothetical protein
MMRNHRTSASPPRAARPRRGCRLAPILLAALATAMMPAPRAQAPAAPGLDAAGLLAQLYPDAACAEEHVIGQCYCGSLPCGLRIERYVPVAFVETTRAPGDSLFDFLQLPAAAPASTASSSLSSTDNTAEVHVWSLPDAPIPGLACLSCGAASAAVPAPATDAGAPRCGPAALVAGATARAAAAATGFWLPRLSYASELDMLNWRTGCRDLGDLVALAPGPLPACVRGGGPPACLGKWGLLRPRQMRDIGPTPLLYSAKTAVRAMSIARDQIGSFGFPVDTDGKLQQAYPVVSACFGVGQLPLPQAPASPRPVLTSADGRYGWVYWRPATCCVGFASARQCLGLH